MTLYQLPLWFWRRLEQLHFQRQIWVNPLSVESVFKQIRPYLRVLTFSCEIIKCLKTTSAVKIQSKFNHGRMPRFMSICPILLINQQMSNLYGLQFYGIITCEDCSRNAHFHLSLLSASPWRFLYLFQIWIKSETIVLLVKWKNIWLPHIKSKAHSVMIRKMSNSLTFWESIIRSSFFAQSKLFSLKTPRKLLSIWKCTRVWADAGGSFTLHLIRETKTWPDFHFKN